MFVSPSLVQRGTRMTDHGFVPLVLWAKDNCHPVQLVLNSGISLGVLVAAVGRDAFSGEAEGTGMGAVVVPMRSVSWIDLTGMEASWGPLEDIARPSFRTFIENSRRLSHRVTLHTRAGRLTGVIGDTSGDVVALVDATGHRRLVATASVDWFSIGT